MAQGNEAAAVVSFDEEPLILVDEEDNVLGYESKEACHRGEGLLHRAFSVFLIDGRGRLLIQQRSAGKRLWPLYWSNSCCSHPRRGEEQAEAARRRVGEELGVHAPLFFLYQFRYRAAFGDAGAEHELCSVFAGRCDGVVRPNPNEIERFELVEPDALDRELAERPDRYTPWLRLEWPQLRSAHWPEVEALLLD